MSNIKDIEPIRELLDCANGQFNLSQPNFTLCLNAIEKGGVKAMVSVALFNRITSNVYLLKTEGKQKKGSVWSNPIPVEEIIMDCTSRKVLGEKGIAALKPNYSRYIAELIANNVFYRFGKNNFHVYTYEKEVFSWGYMNKKLAFVYPKTVKKLIASKTDLWNLFSHNHKPGVNSSMMIGEFSERFAMFIDELVQKMPPKTKSRFRKYTKHYDASIYLYEVEAMLAKTDDFDGFDEYNSFDESMLPLSVEGKFSELIPGEVKSNSSNAFGHQRRISEKSLFFINESLLAKIVAVNGLPEEQLHVSSDAYHLLSYLERKIKEKRGITDPSLVIFKSLSKEQNQCAELFDRLTATDNRDDDFIKEWIKWFVINQTLDKDFDSSYVICRALLRTYNKFSKSYLIEMGDDKVVSVLYNSMKDKYSIDCTIEELCGQFGVWLSYNFLHVSYGEKEAIDLMLGMFEEISNEEGQKKRTRIETLLKATCSRPWEPGLVTRLHPITKAMDKMVSGNNCRLADLGLSPDRTTDAQHSAFWRKINDERK